MADVRRSPRAEADLEAILTEVDQKNSALAQRVADAFELKGQALARFPEMGRLRSEIAPHLRSTLVSHYVIFYRVEGNDVQILRILHGKRSAARHASRIGGFTEGISFRSGAAEIAPMRRA